MTEILRQISIRGRVQGVGYRAWVEDGANRRSLQGWVRNRRDGTVEALFAGAEPTVTEMIALCRRGPPLAGVEAVDAHPADSDALNLRQPGDEFSVLPTI